MRVPTTDPMTGNEVTETETAPFVIEGDGDDALKIYFESEASRQDYVDFSAESDTTDDGVVDAYNQLGDNETTGTSN